MLFVLQKRRLVMAQDLRVSLREDFEDDEPH